MQLPVSFKRRVHSSRRTFRKTNRCPRCLKAARTTLECQQTLGVPTFSYWTEHLLAAQSSYTGAMHALRDSTVSEYVLAKPNKWRALAVQPPQHASETVESLNACTSPVHALFFTGFAAFSFFALPVLEMLSAFRFRLYVITALG